MSDQRALADRRYREARDARGLRDPRSFYRERLRSLRKSDPASYAKALDYYENTLVPEVAREGSDPIAAWLEYGRILAALTVEGSAVQIDESGLSRPYSPPVPAGFLVLHLPTSTREAALPVGIPDRLSRAQRATYDLLVHLKTG
jgi:hypothetical protein